MKYPRFRCRDSGNGSDQRTGVPYDIWKWATFLVKNGQALPPMVEWIEQSRLAVDELVDVVGGPQMEAVQYRKNVCKVS